MNIVILSNEQVLELVAAELYKLSGDAELFLVTNIPYLEALDAEVKKNSRLISIFSTVVVPQNLLSQFGHGCYNLHPGTPDYPGWRAWSFAILNNAKTFGLTLHEMTQKVDAGSIVSFMKFSLSQRMTENDVREIFIKTLPNFFHSYPDCLRSMDKLPVLSTHWSRKPFPKRDVQKVIQVNGSTSPGLLLTLVRAFGFGATDEKPYIVQNNKRFVLEGNVNLDLEGKDHLEMHGFTFCAHQLEVLDVEALKVKTES